MPGPSIIEHRKQTKMTNLQVVVDFLDFVLKRFCPHLRGLRIASLEHLVWNQGLNLDTERLWKRTIKRRCSYGCLLAGIPETICVLLCVYSICVSIGKHQYAGKLTLWITSQLLCNEASACSARVVVMDLKDESMASASSETFAISCSRFALSTNGGAPVRSDRKKVQCQRVE